MPEDAKTEAAKLQKQFYGDPQGLANHLIRISLSKTDVVYEVFLLLDNLSTLDVGCRFINGCNYFQLVKKNRGFILCSSLYKWLTEIKIPILQPISCAGNAGALLFLKSAIDTAKPEKDEDETKGNPYYTIDADIILESEAIAILDKIGPLYFNKVGKKFNVNSGTRDAHRQAEAMWVKYPKDKIFSEYPNRKLINEILEAIKNAAGKSNAVVIQAVTDVIQSQINRKEYISKHLIAGCIDIATEGDKPTGVTAMSSSEQKIMIEIAVRVTGGTAKKENNPPHVHIQFK